MSFIPGIVELFYFFIVDLPLRPEYANGEILDGEWESACNWGDDRLEQVSWCSESMADSLEGDKSANNVWTKRVKKERNKASVRSTALKLTLYLSLECS